MTARPSCCDVLDRRRTSGEPATRAMLLSMIGPRTYSFLLTVTVEADQPGYEDPEWIADAAQGALANEYGYRCVYGAIGRVDPPEAL